MLLSVGKIEQESRDFGGAVPAGATQAALFAESDAAVAIPGLRYETGFLGVQEEAALLEVVRTLPLHAARYKAYLARRRVVSFGGSYDFEANVLRPGQPLDERLPFLLRIGTSAGTQLCQQGGHVASSWESEAVARIAATGGLDQGLDARVMREPLRGQFQALASHSQQADFFQHCGVAGLCGGL
jgi:hypothetical protein